MPTPNDVQNQINAVPWTNGRGLVTGATMFGLLTAIVGLFAYYAPLANPVFTGTVTMATPLAATSGGTGASTPAGARSGLNVGNFATPQDYGCVENGAADCAAAAASAAAALGVGGQPVNVYLRSGNYLFTSGVTLSNGQSLTCDGPGNTHILVNNSFSPTASGVVTLAGRGSAGNAVRNCQFQFSQPADILTTANAGASSGVSSIVVSAISGNGYSVVVGDIVYDQSGFSRIANQTTVTSISGSGPYTIGLSNNVLSSGVTAGDVIGFAPPRSSYATLSSGCGNGIGCVYPPAVYSASAAFYNVSGNQVFGAWDGFIFTNSVTGGGAGTINDNIMDALDIGLKLDNQPATVSVSNFDCQNLTFSARGPYADGRTSCQSLGRVDGLSETNAVSFLANINFLANSSTSEDTWNFSNFIFDTASINDNASAGGHTITYSSGSMVTGSYGYSPFPAISVTNSRLFFSDFNYATTTPGAVYPISVTGGTLSFSNSFLVNDGTGAGVASVSAGGLKITGTTIVNHNGNTGQPAELAQSGTGSLVISGGSVFGGGTGSPVGVSIGAVNSGNYVHGVSWSGYSLVQPGGVAGATTGNIFYNTPGTYTYYPTPGATSLTITECAAGGGGGGGALQVSGTAVSGGAGGAGGAGVIVIVEHF